MRASSARSLISVGCLLASLLILCGLAPAQTFPEKRKPSRHAVTQIPQPTFLIGARANAAPPLSGDSWTGTSGDNNWGTAGNWSAGLPTSSSAVTIGTSKASVNENLTNAMFGTLALSGSGDSLTIANNIVLQAFGNIPNNGNITINSIGNTAELLLEGNVVLSGTGTLTMSNFGTNYILGTNSLDQLTNQETIQGAGGIGNGQMAPVNSGMIDANQSAGMTINPNDGLTNTVTIEATAGATLKIVNVGASGTGTFNNTGGTITANGGTVQVNSSVINGGTISTVGASTLQLNSGTITGGTVTNTATGTIEIATGTNVLAGTVNNSGGGTLKIDNNAVLDLQNGTYAQLGAVPLGVEIEDSRERPTVFEGLTALNIAGGTSSSKAEA